MIRVTYLILGSGLIFYCWRLVSQEMAMSFQICISIEMQASHNATRPQITEWTDLLTAVNRIFNDLNIGQAWPMIRAGFKPEILSKGWFSSLLSNFSSFAYNFSSFGPIFQVLVQFFKFWVQFFKFWVQFFKFWVNLSKRNSLWGWLSAQNNGWLEPCT